MRCVYLSGLYDLMTLKVRYEISQSYFKLTRPFFAELWRT